MSLRKSYGDKAVLDSIDLRIPAGSVFALLGPNGAGKTTVVQILSTLIAADGGQAQVAGHDVAASPGGVGAAIGVTGQFSAVDNLITGEENMLFMAVPLPRTSSVLVGAGVCGVRDVDGGRSIQALWRGCRSLRHGDRLCC